MDKGNSSYASRRRKSWALVSGVSFLAAALTIIMCALGGVFKFEKRENLGNLNGNNMKLEFITSAPNVHVTPDYNPPNIAVIEPPEVQQYHYISIVASAGGKVAPYGLAKVKEGENLEITITPDPLYVIAELKIDGKKIEPTNHYVFTNVVNGHSLYCVFKLESEISPSPTATPTPTPHATSKPTPTPTPVPSAPAETENPGEEEKP
ncbi:MAG: hypothetical protein GX684_04505 [Ruminococcaceae bacterium]|nr:hypothetical protein [Oscillospiraceae bacterium]